MDEGLVVGRLVGPFGIRGEVKLLPLTDFEDRLARLQELELRFGDGRTERRAILGIRRHKSLYLVRLDRCGRIEDAEALRGAEVWIGPHQVKSLPEGQYYVHEVIGLRVVTEEGEELGQVEEVFRTGANDVYRVGGLLLPATRDAVVRLDPTRGLIITRSRAYLEGEEA
jgi:16S rRNA processing protein RimM